MTEAEAAASLVARIQAGDRDAEGELFSRYSRGLMIMLTQRIGDPELAADMHQDAMIVVLERLRSDGLKEPSQLKAFLWSTATNLFINEYRKKKRRATEANEELYQHVADDTVPGQITTLLTEHAGDTVRQLLEELPQSRDRKILKRHYLDEAPKEAVCTELDLSAAHFDRVIYRAKERFRQIIDRHLNREDWL